MDISGGVTKMDFFPVDFYVFYHVFFPSFCSREKKCCHLFFSCKISLFFFFSHLSSFLIVIFEGENNMHHRTVGGCMCATFMAEQEQSI